MAPDVALGVLESGADPADLAVDEMERAEAGDEGHGVVGPRGARIGKTTRPRLSANLQRQPHDRPGDQRAVEDVEHAAHPRQDASGVLHPRAALGQAFVAGGAGLTPLFQDLARLHRAQGPLRRLRLRAAAVNLCCAVAECAGQGPAEPASADVRGDGRIARFEALIRAHLADGWQLSDYAAALRMSERHLRRLSLMATGLSAHSFVEATRMREACRLLAYTRMRVQEVGFALGYDDPSYFARSFRRATGLSASDYRRRLEDDGISARPPGS